MAALKNLCANVFYCCTSRNTVDYENVLADSEREAVTDLLNFLENRQETDFFTGGPLNALSTLVYSHNIDLQRSASLTFAEITERDVRAVDKNTLEPILFLLESSDIEVQRAASAALGNLAVDAHNKILIVQLGGLQPLIRQMNSTMSKYNVTLLVASQTWLHTKTTRQRSLVPAL